MVSSEDAGGLRHNPRHSGTISRLELLAYGLAKEPGGSPESTFFRKWGVPTDDPHAIDIQRRLARVLRRLSSEEGALFLVTAETIAKAQEAKKSWNPKANRARHVRLGTSTIAAARLALEIAAMYPPPWEGERGHIGDLVAGLVSFIVGNVQATASAAPTLSVMVARRMLMNLKQRLSKKTGGRTYWELIADLAWLISGKRGVPCSERTVRRYLEKCHRSKTPADAYWSRHWELMHNAARLTPGRTGDAFEEAAKHYLGKPIAKRSAEKAAQDRQ